MVEEKIIMKIGGSLLFDSDMQVRKENIFSFIDFIKNKVEKIEAVVIGGGKLARLFISVVTSKKSNQAIGDLFGIKVSRLNALTLATLAGSRVAYQAIPTSIEEVLRVKSLLPDKIMFLGGLEVGQSTTSVACEVAEALGTRMLVIGTDVDGIYTKDPDAYPDAEKLDEVTLAELRKILGIDGGENQAAGEYRILDAVSSSIIMRSGLRVRVVKGDVEVLEAAIKGGDVGTLIKA